VSWLRFIKGKVVLLWEIEVLGFYHFWNGYYVLIGCKFTTQ